jgi:hypothetical protein
MTEDSAALLRQAAEHAPKILGELGEVLEVKYKLWLSVERSVVPGSVDEREMLAVLAMQPPDKEAATQVASVTLTETEHDHAAGAVVAVANLLHDTPCLQSRTGDWHKPPMTSASRIAEVLAAAGLLRTPDVRTAIPDDVRRAAEVMRRDIYYAMDVIYGEIGNKGDTAEEARDIQKAIADDIRTILDYIAPPDGFRVGQRVHWNPAEDCWEPGEVTKVCGGTVWVRLDENGQTLPVAPRHVRPRPREQEVPPSRDRP